MLFSSPFLHAVEVNIKVIPLDGKPVYLLQIGPFKDAKQAEALNKTISAAIEKPTTIEHPGNNGTTLIQIGPISDYLEARALEKKISDPAILPQELAKETSDDAIPPQNIWNLRNADIRAVIAEVSRVTHKNFIIDPRVQGKVSIVSSTPMSEKALYQVFESVLQVSGYAAVPTGDVIKIVPNMEAKTLSPDELSLLKSSPHGDDMMVQVIPVHYVPSDQLIPVLRPLMPQWSNVAAYPPSTMLILSGRANNIKQMADIIKQVDTSSANGIDMIPLKHALAMDVANTLKDLVKPQPGIGLRSQTTLSADDRSNSILLSGSKTDRIRLRLIISQLDKQNPNGQNGNTQVIYLNYLRAEDVVPILAGIAQASFSGTVGTTIGTITRPELDSTNPASSLSNNPGNSTTPAPPPSAPAATPNTTGATTQNEGSTKPTVQIIAEPNTNSIIINAPATLIRTLKTVISQLDIKPAQLLIEALVAEINETDFNNLGIEWGSIDQKTHSPDTFKSGFAILNSKTSISQFQAQIYALARLHKANILSTPSVVVLDNRQAKILIGKQVSVASTNYPNNANGTSTASPYTTFDRVNVALHLYVRPQITRARGIQMQIDQGNDTLDTVSSVDPGNNPTFNISSIVTSVHVESGDIVVLGGLSQDTIGNDNNGIPILKNIPGIGRMFQNSLINHEKKVLMVFIRPHILRTEQDTLNVTGGKYNDVRQTQLDLLRSQPYDKYSKGAVVPPWRSSSLPIPFTNPPLVVKKGPLRP
ncbi:MAG: GspD family T2SS secretin variant LspD [Legionellales bacterium]|nr:GspD family T2SS secretin variant LspD [Legionellales bacterium]